MNDIVQALGQLGGVASKADLIKAGASARALSEAAQKGFVTRPRRGWYSILGPQDPRHRAREFGGRVTGAAALRLHGAWMWSDPSLSVSVPRTASRLPDHPADVCIRYDPPEVTGRGSRSVVDLRDALVAAVPEVTFEEGVALLDWTIHSGSLDTFDRFEVVSRLPRHASTIGDWTDDECQSFLESIVRTRLRCAGHTTDTQVPLSNGQWVDIVVDEYIGLEIDGRSFHESTFEVDRRKDLVITRDEMHAVRVSYSMVKNDWPAVLSAIDAALVLARRAHPVRRAHAQVHLGGPKGKGSWSLPESRSRRTPPGRNAAGG